jgi:carotenoid cleavage dioxygenase-like enzyme
MRWREHLVGLEQEVSLPSLPISGQLPVWLQGTLIRNGPAKFEIGGKRMRHWFDGLAMLHNFSFDTGQVSYLNRFLHSPDYDYAMKHGKMGYVTFAADPCRSLFKRLATLFLMKFTHNANISVSQIADSFVAWTETPIPIEFNPQTLETVGVFDFQDHLNIHASTAHPLTDPLTGDIFNHSVSFSLESHYKLYRIAANGRRREIVASLPVREPGYMHSFSLTKSYIILTELPFILNPLNYLLIGKPLIDNLTWKPERGTHFLVFDRENGHLVGRYSCPAFFCFHHINAFERANEVVIDLLAYSDPRVINSFYVDALTSDSETEDLPGAELRRYTLTLDRSEAQYEPLSDLMMELPNINEHWRFHPQYRYAYTLTTSPQQNGTAHRVTLVKIDLASKRSYLWNEDDCYPGEPIFAANPNGSREDDGVLLSVVFHVQKGTSFLLVLDAQTFQELARAEVPLHIPMDLHGHYFHGIH